MSSKKSFKVFSKASDCKEDSEPCPVRSLLNQGSVRDISLW